MNRHSFLLASIVAVALIGNADFAWAADTSEADALFAEGRDALEKGRYAEACEKLQRSEKLSPAVGTLLNLGFCWEQLGHFRSAMDAYSEAEILAHDAGDEKRSVFARERFTAASARVMTLTIKVQSETTGLTITRNGQTVPKTDWGKPIAVDAGELTVTATAKGKQPWHGSVVGKGDGANLTITVPTLEPIEAARREPSSRWPMAIGQRRAIAVGAAGLGGILLGAGSALALSASSRHDDATSSGHCDARGCDAIGVDMQSRAASQGNVATGLFLTGLVAVGAGVVLWIMSPERTQSRASYSAGVF